MSILALYNREALSSQTWPWHLSKGSPLGPYDFITSNYQKEVPTCLNGLNYLKVSSTLKEVCESVHHFSTLGNVRFCLCFFAGPKRYSSGSSQVVKTLVSVNLSFCNPAVFPETQETFTMSSFQHSLLASLLAISDKRDGPV